MERIFKGRPVDGDFKPFELSVWRETLLNWPHATVYAILQDEERMKTRQQEKYWHGVIVPIVEQCWMHEMGWACPPPKGVTHGALVGAIFGKVDTPLGPERRSSATFTFEEYSILIDGAKDYAMRKYRVRIPEPNEGPA